MVYFPVPEYRPGPPDILKAMEEAKDAMWKNALQMPKIAIMSVQAIPALKAAGYTPTWDQNASMYYWGLWNKKIAIYTTGKDYALPAIQAPSQP